MKFYVKCLAFLFLCGCGHRVMTMDSFYDIPVGSTQEELKKEAGAPYEINDKGDGEVEYVYIEKLNMGRRIVEERHYYFTLKNGKIVSKRVKERTPPPYSINSYDLQTSYKEGESIKSSESEGKTSVD